MATPRLTFVHTNDQAPSLARARAKSGWYESCAIDPSGLLLIAFTTKPISRYSFRLANSLSFIMDGHNNPSPVFRSFSTELRAFLLRRAQHFF
jgi:hypothetical protein